MRKMSKRQSRCDVVIGARTKVGGEDRCEETGRAWGVAWRERAGERETERETEREGERREGGGEKC